MQNEPVNQPVEHPVEYEPAPSNLKKDASRENVMRKNLESEFAHLDRRRILLGSVDPSDWPAEKQSRTSFDRWRYDLARHRNFSSKIIFVENLLSPEVFSTKGVFDEVDFRRKNSVPFDRIFLVTLRSKGYRSIFRL